jgi:hypothetical protein
MSKIIAGARTKVVSTNIESVGYDQESKTLQVEFKNGGIWQYSGVPAEEVVKLHAAESFGGFFHKNIRSKYPGEKVGEVVDNG